MTPEQFTAQLPTLTCNPLPAKPPFVFNGLSSRVFPLRANMDALQRFCNAYLNIVPESVGRFRASVPYVYLAMLDYGQIADGSGIGWFAQVEVFFAVPVEWYRKVDGRWVFHDWATVTPYIYVDDDFSIPMGRSVFGYPKALCRVARTPSSWIRDARAPQTLASIETSVFPTAYAGMSQEHRVFLEVERAAPLSPLELPLRADLASMPWTIASQLAQTASGLGRDALWLAQSRRIEPMLGGNTDVSQLGTMLSRLAPGLVPSGPGMIVHALNLKQMRRSDAVDEICYQALTDGAMRIDAFVAGGLQGEERIRLGDTSGGHVIRLWDYPMLPIVRQLGLEVHRSWRDGGVAVHELKPVMPFWMQADISLLGGANLAWRGESGLWRDSAGATITPDSLAAPDTANTAGTPQQSPPPTPPLFNTMVASSLEAITGPFKFAGASMRVLPLLADRTTLQKHLDTLINDALRDPVQQADGTLEPGVRLRVWSRPQGRHGNAAQRAALRQADEPAYVYLTATDLGNVTSESNNIGDWVKYELAFLVPVCWERLQLRDGKEHWELEGVGVVPTFFFVNDCRAAITRQEVQGIDARTANFTRPACNWLSQERDGSAPSQVLLRVDAEAWLAIDADQQANIQPLVEIIQNRADAGLGSTKARENAYQWAIDLRSELLSKKETARAHPDEAQLVRTLALELLGNQAPLAMYSLKQLRDAADPNHACYQALVRVPRAIDELHDLSEIEETLVVRIHDYPKLNIVGTLGLLGVRDTQATPGIVHDVQAIRPFTLHVSMSEALSERLLWRCGTKIWSVDDHAFSGRLGSNEGEDQIQVRTGDETIQDRIAPNRIAQIMAASRARTAAGTHDGSKSTAFSTVVRWRRNGQPGPGPDLPLDRSSAKRSVTAIDPQMVIESILSREWGRYRPERWLQARAALQQAIDRLPVGSVPDRAAWQALHQQTFGANLNRRGFPEPLARMHNELLDTLAQVSERRAAMEQHYAADYFGLAPLHDMTKQELVAALQNVAKLELPVALGNINQVNHQQAYLYRLRELLNAANQPNPAWQSEAVTEARRWCDAIQEAICDALARAGQKPDHCIRRDAVADQHDVLLGREWSWDDSWYAGRDMAPDPSAP